MKKQKYYFDTNQIKDDFFERLNKQQVSKIFVVCDQSLKFLNIKNLLDTVEDSLNLKLFYFSAFTPNPNYDSVVEGVKAFDESAAEIIFAIGGGSSIDVAKCIKAFANMDKKQIYLDQKIIPNDIPFIAMPTTAGTGSESTQFAVIYYNNQKQSVTDESLIPDHVILDPSVLISLPAYHKKSTLLDAFCHGIESYWSINSTNESKRYAKESIKLIMENSEEYMKNNEDVYKDILLAANLSGKAINISQTTAGHAMSYKMSSLYKIAHGHAVGLCLPKIWKNMLQNIGLCIDPRGKEYLQCVFLEIAELMNCNSAEEAIVFFETFLADMEMSAPVLHNLEELEILVESVNLNRLENNPVKLDKTTLRKIYMEIMKK